MKIKLSNFRCHKNAEYEIPDNGLILLSGESGAGKSTLLKAIVYALYGNKAVKKPCTFGENTCSVKLQIFGMTIHRTNKPNRLIVNNLLEDDAAQEYINEKIGMSFEEFMISSYIPQKNNSSILSLPPTEQLGLIKTLAFSGEENITYRDKLLLMIKQSSEILLQKRTQLEFVQNEVTRLSSDLHITSFPLPMSEGGEDSCIEEYKNRMKNFNTNMQKFLEKKSELSNLLDEFKSINLELQILNERLKEINDNIKITDKKISDLQIVLKNKPIDLEILLQQNNEKINIAESFNNLKKLKDQYQNLLLAEQEEKIHETQKLKSDLWNNGNENTSTIELNSLKAKFLLIEKYNNGLNLLKKLGLKEYNKKILIDKYTLLNTQLTNEKNTLNIKKEKMEMQKELITCPECNANLKWQGEKLISVKNVNRINNCDYEKEIAQLTFEIKAINDKISCNENLLQKIYNIDMPDTPDTDVDIDKIKMLENYINENKITEIQLQNINNKQESITLKNLRISIEKLSNEYDYTEIDNLCNNIDKLREQSHIFKNELMSFNENLNLLKNLELSRSDLLEKYNNITKKISDLKKRLLDININNIQKDLIIIENDIESAKQQQVKDTNLLKKVEEYLLYRERKSGLDHWQKQLDELVGQVKLAENIHTANLILKDKYSQAEIMAVENTIYSINEHTKYYLDTFFPENELSVIMQPNFKGKKIQTLKIDNSITFKGNEYDNLNQMSGGEFDRCTLASICGINSMLGSPILILDESLSSLDSDTNTEIISFLKELANEKLILTCSHEAVRGIFDKVISIN